ncbi:superoxide dismutase [Candidatus Pacearchaeota archaeon CG10_big_fil_rev_8_21_14_0_10_30_48]|nr:MAG: superoxide dismutase [Candidatus Pacearchaeota archaeon CG10_big_fil_rev_8_21_14_0_10_30_48]
MTFTLPKLPYEYFALEPYIDAKTMEIHHSKHHQGYVDKLNAALNRTDLENKPLKEILSNINSFPEDKRTAIINNGGGHANHSLFWELMISNPEGKENKPEGELSEEINKTFGSFEEFKEKFSNIALTRFGSGWAWLIKNHKRKLEITSTPNQDSPIMDGNIPILGLDVWEHAYYLKYQNKRIDYINAFFKVINWKKVEELFKGN